LILKADSRERQRSGQQMRETGPPTAFQSEVHHMPQQTDFPLPSDLPRPTDDGAADDLNSRRRMMKMEKQFFLDPGVQAYAFTFG
jgi:hypothetical protein